MLQSTVKEIKQNISKERYEELAKFPSAFEMRESVKHQEVPRCIWHQWYGCKLLRLEDEYVLIHVVDVNLEGDML